MPHERDAAGGALGLNCKAISGDATASKNSRLTGRKYHAVFFAGCDSVRTRLATTSRNSTALGGNSGTENTMDEHVLEFRIVD
jgi:hypothetical protein